ncbi:TPA: ead/Ea22-like family protein [Klebsiella variicola subsp. variicola]|nr:ead/Ea22-like family protein [Klebsiella variicola subsp. variicola]HCB0801357.1 ead/Ea22-like family protein [Klebsiella variicola subsp. variicola]
MTDITELAQSLKAAAEKATPGRWEYYPGNTSIEYNVDSMDEDQGSIVYADSGDFTQAQTDRNGEFIALANSANILALVEALEKAQGMETYWKTQCRGITDHCEELQARIAELESRTVKLPDDEDGQAYGFGKWSNSKLPATAGTMTIAYCEDAWRAAFEVFSSAVGIKVEADGLDADGSNRNKPGMVVAVHIDVGDFVKFRGQVYEVKETDFDDHDVTLWFVCGEVLKCAAGCPIEVVSAPVENE